MNKVKFVGLDLSLTNSGVCVIGEEGKVLDIDSVKTDPCGSTIEERFARYRKIASKLWKIVKHVKGDIASVAVENFSYGSKGRIIQIVESGTLVRYCFIKGGVNMFIEVAPIQLKKYLLGKVKGKGAAIKNVMCREVFRKFGEEIDDDNQVDAFILAHIARDYWHHTQGKKPGKSKTFGKPQAEVLLKLLQKHGG